MKKNTENISSYLHTDGMAAGYGGKIVVDGVELYVNKGEILTLIGPNGSGKSTVLRSITGQLKLIKGAVFLDGKDMTEIGRHELARKVSLLMTDRIKTELMTCFDVAATARYPYTGSFGLLGDEDRRIVSEALERVNADELAGRDFNMISDGQKQRILLARCIAQEPELIVLDEPTSFLDIKYKIELLQILKGLARDKGTAIIMSMHEIDFARRVSDRVVCIGRKGIDRIGKPDEVLTQKYLCELFDIDKEEYLRFFLENNVPVTDEVIDTGKDEGAGADIVKGQDEGVKAGKDIANGYIAKNGKLLRKGVTTGTCAAAAAYGAAKKLLMREELKKVSLITPSGEKVEVDINRYDRIAAKAESSEDRAAFYVIKDSGDDPDVTNGAKIIVSVILVNITNKSGACAHADIDINIDPDEDKTGNPEYMFTDETYPGIFLAGGEGVGTVTMEGLEQPVGYPAINKVPRRMIFEAVDSVRNEAGYEGNIFVTVSVENGGMLADKTFNPQLGIEGGISILGTSGILEPMSEKAIVDTIEMQIKQQAALGKKSLLVTPGLYGQNYVKNDLGMSLEGAVKCSNFIGETIDMAGTYGFEEMLLVGNIGKLVKLAAGIMNTHSRVADARMDIMCTHLALCGGTTDMAKEIYKCINTDSALEKLKEWGLFDEVIASLLDAIRERISRRAASSLKVTVKIFSEKYGFLGEVS